MRTGNVTLRAPAGAFAAYVAEPDDGGSAAIALVHDEHGLDDHAMVVAHRFVAEGYAVIAPMLVVATGSASDYCAAATSERVLADLVAARVSAAARWRVPERRMAVVGFGFGGYAAFLGACKGGFGAAVSFYAPGLARRAEAAPLCEPAVAHVRSSTAPVLCLAGANDAALPPAHAACLWERLADARVERQIVVYPHAGRGFFRNDDTTYVAGAATDAWTRTMAWVRRHTA